MLFSDLSIARANSTDTLASSISEDSTGDGYSPEQRASIEKQLWWAHRNLCEADQHLMPHTVTALNFDHHFSVTARDLCEADIALKQIAPLMANKRSTDFNKWAVELEQHSKQVLTRLNYLLLKQKAQSELSQGEALRSSKHYEEAIDAYARAGSFARAAGQYAAQLVHILEAKQGVGAHQLSRRQRHRQWQDLAASADKAVARVGTAMGDVDGAKQRYSQRVAAEELVTVSMRNVRSMVNVTAEQEYRLFGAVYF